MITADDVQDELLHDEIKDVDIGDAYNYLCGLAKTLGIELDETLLYCKLIQVAYACMSRAKYLSTYVQSEDYNGQSVYDAWEMKRKLYREELDSLTAEIRNNPSLLGTVSDIGSASIPLWRC